MGVSQTTREQSIDHPKNNRRGGGPFNHQKTGMRLREIVNEFDNMMRVIELHGARATVPKPELVQAQIPEALKHHYDWGIREEELFMKLPGMSLSDLIKKGCSLPWALPWLSGSVRTYYQRSYAWQLLHAFKEPFFWYKESRSFDFCDTYNDIDEFHEVLRFSAQGGWSLAHLSKEEADCYRRMTAVSLVFQSKQFDRKTRSPRLDEEIRRAFTQALKVEIV